MQQPADMSSSSLAIELFGDAQRIRVDFEHAAQARPSLIHRRDAREIVLYDLPRCRLATVQPGLEPSNADFLEAIIGRHRAGSIPVRSNAPRTLRSDLHGSRSTSRRDLAG